MSQRQNVNPESLAARPFDIFNNRWFLLACGDFDNKDFNMMTVAWGSLGTMWYMPFAMIVVRPQRHTMKFLDRFDNFTLSTFPEEFKHSLTALGTRSGTDMDKVNESGLTPEASQKVSSPSFKEADLVLECEKIYTDSFKPENIIPEGLAQKVYPANDYHRIFFGKVVSVSECPPIP